MSKILLLRPMPPRIRPTVHSVRHTAMVVCIHTGENRRPRRTANGTGNESVHELRAFVLEDPPRLPHHLHGPQLYVKVVHQDKDDVRTRRRLGFFLLFIATFGVNIALPKSERQQRNDEEAHGQVHCWSRLKISALNWRAGHHLAIYLAIYYKPGNERQRLINLFSFTK